MKNNILLFLVSLITLHSFSFAKKSVSVLKEHKTTLYFGGFKNSPTDDFCVLYDGEVIDVKDMSFSIKEIGRAHV